MARVLGRSQKLSSKRNDWRINFRKLRFTIILSGCWLLGLSDRPILSQITLPLLSQVRILGQPCDRSYVVVIPARDRQILRQVQQRVPTAFLTNSRLGWYIQAGAFASRAPAEALGFQLRQQFRDVRVAYLPVRCQ